MKVVEYKLHKDIFDIVPNDSVIKDAIVLTLAGLRQGTHKTKNRSEVRGGGRKPWRQKGTGNARQGSIRAVQWVGGGRYATPVPRDYSKKMNRKERVLALKGALAYKKNDIIVVDNLVMKTPKTKDFIKALKDLKLENTKTLVITDELEENLILASRNIAYVNLLSDEEINVLDILDNEKILVTEKAMKNIEEAFK